MEELAEGAFKGVLRLLSFAVRALIWLIYSLLFEILAWYAGWPICRTLSFGKYPKQFITDYDQASMFGQIVVSMVGLVALLGLGALLALLIGHG